MSVHAFLTRYIYWPLAQTLKREYSAHALAELSQSQWRSQEELRSKQWDRLRCTVNKAAQEVPYYRQAYARMGWDFTNKEFSYEAFLNLPTIEKDTLRDQISEFLNPKYHGRVTQGMTSGSTGKSLTLYYNSEHESYSEAARWRAKSWWGVAPGCRQVTLWGRPYTGTKERLNQQLKSYLMNTLLFSAFDMQEQKLKQIGEKILRFKPHILYGYPSSIFSLAEYFKKNEIHAHMMGTKVIMITAESSTSEQRSFIEETFGCKTANEYGCSETGGFVYECPQGSWHISSELTFIEFLDSRGHPVSPGETGEIVLTHLRNDYMPLIRYRVGDRGSPSSESCACRRGLPLMQVSVAKERDYVQLSNGQRHTSEIFVYINKAVMKKYPSSIMQFRVVQKSIDLLQIQVVPGATSIDNAEELFKRLLNKQLGRNIRILFKRVSRIEREPTGKLSYFISEINT